MEQGLEFIACIENKGIVHRDIKPENIIRADDGRIFSWILELQGYWEQIH